VQVQVYQTETRCNLNQITKLFHGRKVTTVNARDIKYMVCYVIDNSSHVKELSCQLGGLHKKKKRNREEIKKFSSRMKKERKNKTFHLQTVTTTTTVRCLINQYTPLLTFKTIIAQFPINLAEAVTCHKLQGLSLEKMIITGWGLSFMKNWEYTVLSPVKTR
jgi:hypothetical protein